jgi:cytochrome c1
MSRWTTGRSAEKYCLTIIAIGVEGNAKLSTLERRVPISKTARSNLRAQVSHGLPAYSQHVLFVRASISSGRFSATDQAQPQDKKVAHLAGSDSVFGLQLYKRYCVVCHGNDLKGYGRVSPEFKNPLPNLSTLAQRHEVNFPDEYVQCVVRNGVQKPGDTIRKCQSGDDYSAQFPARIPLWSASAS